DNGNQGIYVHAAATSGSAGVKLINNTVYHDNGSAIKLENNGSNINLYNNNDIFLGKPGANSGRWLGTTSVTLANWRTASGKDAASIAQDPQFLDIDG